MKSTVVSLVFCVSSSMNLQAGTIDPVSAPGSTMVTLQQIYEGVDRLESRKFLSSSTTEMMEGYYQDTTLVTVDPDLVASNIRDGVVIFGISGTYNGVVNPTPENMRLIPAGSFVMGATTNVGHESISDASPQHTVYVSAFYLDQYEVTKALWDAVKAHNGGNGYSYSNAGRGKATNHPVHTVNWYDVVKWCNARSEMEGLTPVYFTDAGFTSVYKTGEVAPHADWEANGYRLPTEAEWEKAARGGAGANRYPVGDTITHSDANWGYHPTFYTGASPYTSPVDYFAPNGYGLYDMSGNVFEWCWDWYSSSYYSSSPSTDPKGPSLLFWDPEYRPDMSYHVLRGGSWNYSAVYSRVAYRHVYAADQIFGADYIGFRCARGFDFL